MDRLPGSSKQSPVLSHLPNPPHPPQLSEKIKGYVLISPQLHLFLQNAAFGLTEYSDDTPWSKYSNKVLSHKSEEKTSLEVTLADPKQLKLIESSSPSSTCEEIRSLVTRRLYRRTTLLQLIELYAINNQGEGINSKRRRGWLQVDATLLEYFPETQFPLDIRTFINQQTSPNPISNQQLTKLHRMQDRLIQRVYDHHTLI